ncbi:hypothetical protein, partial [Pseudomonas syringae]
GVFNAVCLGLSHVVSLRLLRHLARDTFFRGKVTQGRIDAVVIPRLSSETATVVGIEEIHHNKRKLLMEQVLNEDNAFPSSIFDLTAKPLPEPIISALCKRPWYFLNGYFNDGAVVNVLETTVRRQPL